jgi:hypothetical protein
MSGVVPATSTPWHSHFSEKERRGRANLQGVLPDRILAKSPCRTRLAASPRVAATPGAERDAASCVSTRPPGCMPKKRSLCALGVSAVKDLPKAESLKPRAGFVCPLLPRVGDPVIDQPAPSEALRGAVPVHDLAVHLAGEVEQADVEIFHLHAGGVDFG